MKVATNLSVPESQSRKKICLELIAVDFDRLKAETGLTSRRIEAVAGIPYSQLRRLIKRGSVNRDVASILSHTIQAHLLSGRSDKIDNVTRDGSIRANELSPWITGEFTDDGNRWATMLREDMRLTEPKFELTRLTKAAFYS